MRDFEKLITECDKRLRPQYDLRSTEMVPLMVKAHKGDAMDLYEAIATAYKAGFASGMRQERRDQKRKLKHS